MITPTPAALAAAKSIKKSVVRKIGSLGVAYEELPDELAIAATIDSALAAERERVAVVVALTKTIRENLGNAGYYSISRSDRYPMGLAETIFWGDLFEKIDAALAAMETK